MNLMEFLAAFQKGKEVANPTTWKNRAMAMNAVSGVLVTLFLIARFAGYDVPISHEALESISSGLVDLVLVANLVLHVVTSTKVGVPSKPAPVDDSASLYRGGPPPGLG